MGERNNQNQGIVPEETKTGILNLLNAVEEMTLAGQVHGIAVVTIAPDGTKVHFLPRNPWTAVGMLQVGQLSVNQMLISGGFSNG